MLQNALAVFAGGAFGSLFRFLISEFFPLNKFGIPFTIILVNFAGCFVMGFTDSLYESKIQSAQIKHFLMVGLLGGFTTFSTFSLEFANLLKQGDIARSFLYAAVSVLMAFVGFFAGYMLAKIFK
jgi:CrcB protein